ncbi:MAG: ferrochelatase [Gammaproteobacteria bacterium]|nr:ferrochelatase [Gammaproteobacteria bacterium]MDH3857662.1 ferrochelatase [Gammaproteobacteria bacterium]
MSAKIAVLLTNLGTPDRLERASVKRFLKEFLSDPLVVRLPSIFWLPLLYGIILPLRSGKTLQAYSRVWSEAGSPLMAYSNKQRAALQQKLLEQAHVDLAMRYGNPSYESVLRLLRDAGIDKLVVLPLYPQYSVTTTATSYKHLINTLKNLDFTPALEFVGYYPDHPAYIEALAESIREHWQQGQRHLLMSFHGLPQANVDRGDPYQAQCEKTANLLAASLGLGESDWSIGYQSRFGKQAWIQPYTSDMLQRLVARGIKAVDVVCPGFSSDCLETLDEIEVEYRNEFIELGGEQFSYIHALNDRDAHIEMMRQLVEPHLT